MHERAGFCDITTSSAHTHTRGMDFLVKLFINKCEMFLIIPFVDSVGVTNIIQSREQRFYLPFENFLTMCNGSNTHKFKLLMWVGLLLMLPGHCRLFTDQTTPTQF